MLDPNSPNVFAQAMNNYSCPTLGLYSQQRNSMYTLLFGGISASMFSDGSNCSTSTTSVADNCCTAWISPPGDVFTVCCNLPFTNDITTVAIDSSGVYRQYLMGEKYPVINPNPYVECPDARPPVDENGYSITPIYYFGASAAFIPTDGLPTYPNGVVAFDKLGNTSTFAGYIIGGIASTIRDTNCTSDTIASNYIFKVTIHPQ
jgi:hypothetical protein